MVGDGSYCCGRRALRILLEGARTASAEPQHPLEYLLLLADGLAQVQKVQFDPSASFFYDFLVLAADSMGRAPRE